MTARQDRIYVNPTDAIISTVDGTQEAAKAGKCWNGSLGVGAVVHGPVAGPVGIGVSGGSSLGFSYEGSLLDSRFFFQVQAAGMVGSGVFGGVGVSAQGGAGAVPFGINTAESWHSELNLGVGVGGSAVLDVLPGGGVAGGGFHGRIPGGRIGVAVGAAAGTGVGTTTTIGGPTIREMLQALSLLPGTGLSSSDCN